MRRHILLLALLLLLAACSQGEPPEPASPPKTPAAEAPAQSTPATAEAAAPLFGSWTAAPGNCSSPIVISEKRFEGAENICDITSIEDTGDGRFTVSLSCTSEGQTSSERVSMLPVFGPEGEGIMLNYVDRGGEPVTVFRCK